MQYIVGVALILLGIAWFILTAAAAAMASRATSRKENLLPLLGILPVVVGIVLMIVGW